MPPAAARPAASTPVHSASTAITRCALVINIVADKVIEKYKNATCEELREQKAKPKSDQEKNIIEILKDDSQMRTAFVDKIAAPVVNKMFECGMVP